MVAWLTPKTRHYATFVTTLNLVSLGQTVCALVGVQKLGCAGAPALCDGGVAAHIEISLPVCVTTPNLVVLRSQGVNISRGYTPKLDSALPFGIGAYLTTCKHTARGLACRIRSLLVKRRPTRVHMDFRLKNWALASCLSRSLKVTGTDIRIDRVPINVP